MAHILRPNLAPQRPVMMSEHVALTTAYQALEQKVRQLECRLFTLMDYHGLVSTVTEIKDDTGSVRALEFGCVPRIAAPPSGGTEKQAEADATAN